MTWPFIIKSRKLFAYLMKERLELCLYFRSFPVFKIWELLILMSVSQYKKTSLSQAVENQTSIVKLMT